MDRVAVFVDAGYLFAQGAKELCGQKLERRFVSLDYQAAAKQLTEFAEEVSGLPLLRIYWYDGTSIGPTPQHNTLADQPNIKARLGFVNSMGEQKGVDSLIVTDATVAVTPRTGVADGRWRRWHVGGKPGKRGRQPTTHSARIGGGDSAVRRVGARGRNPCDRPTSAPHRRAVAGDVSKRNWPRLDRPRKARCQGPVPRRLGGACCYGRLTALATSQCIDFG